MLVFYIAIAVIIGPGNHSQVRERRKIASAILEPAIPAVDVGHKVHDADIFLRLATKDLGRESLNVLADSLEEIAQFLLEAHLQLIWVNGVVRDSSTGRNCRAVMLINVCEESWRERSGKVNRVHTERPSNNGDSCAEPGCCQSPLCQRPYEDDGCAGEKRESDGSDEG